MLKATKNMLILSFAAVSFLGSMARSESALWQRGASREPRARRKQPRRMQRLKDTSSERIVSQEL